MTETTNNNNAPIVELVVGMHFNGFVFSNQEIYGFYNTIKDRYPIIQEHPPLPFLINKPVDLTVDKSLPFFTSRKFFLNELENKLIQIQLDKVLFNWRKTTHDDQYPHFNKVYAEFVGIIKQLKSLDEISKNICQLEVTYLDHILLDDFDKTDFNPSCIFNLYKLNGIVNHIRSTFIFPNSEIEGNFTIDLKSAINNTKNKKLFVLETNCRGSLGNKTIDEWFYCAHSSILKLFREITTDEARLKWRI